MEYNYLAELQDVKRMIDQHYIEMLREHTWKKELFQDEYKRLAKKNPGYWELKDAVKASKKMQKLQKQFSLIKGVLGALQIRSKTQKAMIRKELNRLSKESRKERKLKAMLAAGPLAFFQ
jgi:hypothetical protein